MRLYAKYRAGGIKAFAADHQLPYDRVRDHLKGVSRITLQATLQYMELLGLSWSDMAARDESPGS